KELANRRVADALASAVSSYEELPEVDLSFRFPKKRVCDKLAFFFEENGLVLPGVQPPPHALGEFCDVHRIAIPFVLNQLMVQLCERGNIIEGGVSITESHEIQATEMESDVNECRAGGGLPRTWPDTCAPRPLQRRRHRAVQPSRALESG